MPSELQTALPGSANSANLPLEIFPGAGTANATLLDSVSSNRFRASSSDASLSSGIFTVGRTGQVELDYLLDGGAYTGELAVFSLSGLSNILNQTDLVQEAARRALSNSELGYVVISDPTEAAKFGGALPGEAQDWNTGIYRGIKTLNLRPGDQFGMMLVPNGTVQQVLDNPVEVGDRPLFSFTWAPGDVQLADLTGDGSAFTLEDLSLANGSDRDYNDLSFQVIGATGSATSLDNLPIAPGRDWRQTPLGEDVQSYIETRLLQETISLQGLTSGVFTVGSSGQVGIDYLFDGGAYQGELAIFSLEGLDQHDWKLVDLIQEVARRALSDSDLGHVAIADQTEGARFTGLKPGEGEDWNEGIYQGVKNLAMKPGSKFGVMLVPNGTVQEVFNDPTVRGDLRPLFSIVPANPRSAFHLGQIADVTGAGSAFSMEDLRVDKGSDHDYNDIVFQVRGAIGQANLLDQYIDPQKDWRKTDLGQSLIEYTRPYAATESFRGENISNPLLETLFGTGTAPQVNISTINSSELNALPTEAPWLNRLKTDLAGIQVAGTSVLEQAWSQLPVITAIVNEQLNQIQGQINSATTYSNSWLDYIQNQISGSANYTNDWLNYAWKQLDSATTYSNAWLDYANNQASSAANYTNEWLDYTWRQLDAKTTSTNDWLNWTRGEINRNATNTNIWLNDARSKIDSADDRSVSELNNLSSRLAELNVEENLWERYSTLADGTATIFRSLWNQYDVLRQNAVDTFNTDWNRYGTLQQGAISTFKDVWRRYSAMVTEAVADFDATWDRYDMLKSATNNALNAAWNRYNSYGSNAIDVFNTFWSQRNSLQNDLTNNLNQAWTRFDKLKSDSLTILINTQNSLRGLEQSWQEWQKDTQAELDVWAKIVASKSRWYNTALVDQQARTGLPLIGIVDTGFWANHPDIDNSRIILGRDWVEGDDNPLVPSGTWRGEHGSQMLDIIAGTRNNGIGVDGLNDQSPLWLGRAIGSGDWAQSLVEFVDTTKRSQQPNAVINLSLDLTETHSDGSVTTRTELTALERAALTYSQLNNILVVVSAGNEGQNLSAWSQASKEFDNLMIVGAAEGWNRANYSSYGEVDYENYGAGIDILAQGTAENGAVGTSVAAAKVAGAASLVWSANPGLNYTQVIDLLKRTATDLSKPNWDVQTGLGLLNTSAAVLLAKVTKPKAYIPAHAVVLQDILGFNDIPERYWQQFYELNYYQELEAKFVQSAWNSASGSTATERPDGWGGAIVGAVAGGVLGGAAGAAVGAVVGSYIEDRVSSSNNSGNSQAVNQAQQERDRIQQEGTKAIDSAQAEVNKRKADGQAAIAAGETNVNNARANANAAIAAGETNVNNARANANAAIAVGEQKVEEAKKIGPEALAAAEQELAQTKASVQQVITNAERELAQTKASVQQVITNAERELAQTKASVQQVITNAERELAQTKASVQQAIAVADARLEQAKRDFANSRKSNNPFQQFADDLSAGLKSTLDNADVVLDVLRKIPVVGTVVNGIEGLIALAQGDWIKVAKKAINAALDLIPGGSSIPEKLVDISVNVGWALVDKKYDQALANTLKDFKVEPTLADTLVGTAWALKDGDWKTALNKGLSKAGFENADKFVQMAWSLKDNQYEQAFKTGLTLTGFDATKVDAFVNISSALKQNKLNQELATVLTNAKVQNAQQIAQVLSNNDPNDDQAALSQALSSIGFQSSDQWAGMVGEVKTGNLFKALSTGFNLVGFNNGQKWVDMAQDLKEQKYDEALATGFQLSNNPDIANKGGSLVKVATSLRQGNYVEAVYAGLSLVPGLDSLIATFKAIQKTDFKAVANSLPKAALALASYL